MTTAVETKMKKTEASFTSTFVGLSGYPDGVGMYTPSPAVELEDRLWSVRIYPGGIDNDAKGFLSCYVVCESSEATRASFRISVLNQKGWKNHHYVSDSVKQFQNYSSSCVNYWGDPKFISKANLTQPSNGICVDDKIIIRVELTIYGVLEQYIRTPMSQQHVGSPPKRRTILDDLCFLLGDHSLADVTILSPAAPTEAVAQLPPIQETEEDDPAMTLSFDDGDAVQGGSETVIDTHDEGEPPLLRIPAHRFLLALRSPVFKAMFQAEMSEATSSEILIRDFDAGVMQEFVRFMYTDKLDRPALDRHAEQLLAAACKYQVPGLESLCENYLCASLTVSNVVNVLYLADLYSAAQLKARALHYIAHNAKEVVTADGFFQGLSFGLCQEVIRALAGVESSVAALDGQLHGPHTHSSVLTSPSSDSSPGKPFVA
jgi:hypothetical protein